MAEKIETPAQVTPKPEEIIVTPVTPEVKETPKAPETPSVPEKPVTPEKYDLKLKEGSKLDAKHLEKISAFAKAKGLSNEDAQALLDHDEENFSEISATQEEEVKKVKESWLPASQNDKEIGGESFKANVEIAKRVVSRYGSDEFKSFLETTGFGNHPEVIRVFLRLGKAMTEDQLVVSSTPVGKKKSTEEILYGTET